ncbi:hypothetical protein BpHYR1_010561 [Brachionus plicatilis]|uniref:Uncharacterized protein n=1 Tax=Brachionus plicatilis TaxID=10195 RepID=A0A3M7T881_BRAPC|nr:hypothetical protein BpHYR1_010561 [Brachionus plicatilis]
MEVISLTEQGYFVYKSQVKFKLFHQQSEPYEFFAGKKYLFNRFRYEILSPLKLYTEIEKKN